MNFSVFLVKIKGLSLNLLGNFEILVKFAPKFVIARLDKVKPKQSTTRQSRVFGIQIHKMEINLHFKKRTACVYGLLRLLTQSRNDELWAFFVGRGLLRLLPQSRNDGLRCNDRILAFL